VPSGRDFVERRQGQLRRAPPYARSFDIVAMVTMFDEPAERSRSHGLRPEVLAAQAERLRLRQVIAAARGRLTTRPSQVRCGS
jgi:hypothetical protein